MTTQKASETLAYINELSDDLLQEILIQLPSLLVFQCKIVCKRWLSVISDSYFTRQFIHTHHDDDDPISNSFNFMLQYNEVDLNAKVSKYLQPSSIHHLKVVPADINTQLRIIRFVDPKFFAVSYFNDLIVFRKSGDYYLCNPLTRKQIMVPPPDSLFAEETIIGLVCYPNWCDRRQTCSNNASYTYKIVRIPKFSEFRSEFQVEIFSSESNEWCKSVVSSSGPLVRMEHASNIVTYNGILHWIDDDQNIIAYDPLSHENGFRVIDPPIEARLYEAIDVGVCAGNLKLCQVTNYTTRYWASLIVWKLEDYSEGRWRLEHEIYLKHMKSDDAGIAKQVKNMLPALKMVGFHPLDGDVIYLNFPDTLVAYNMKTTALSFVCKIRNQGKGNSVKGNLVWGNLFPLLQRCCPTPVPPL